MANLSKLSDDELEAIASGKPTRRSLAEMSDAELEKIAKGPISKAESAMRGAAQGASFGFADELTALVGGAIDSMTSPVDFSTAREGWTSAIRRRDAEAQEENPMSFGGGVVGGSVLASLVPGGRVLDASRKATTAGRLGTAAGEGAIAGAGFSDADVLSGEFVGDVAKGAALGTAAQGSLDAGGKLLKTGAKKAAAVLGGVSPANVTKYLADPDSIRGAKSLEEIKDLADTEVGKIKLQGDELKGAKAATEAERDKLETALKVAFSNTRDKIKGKTAEAKETLKNAWQSKIEALRQESGVPLEVADDLIGRMNAQKAVLGTLSEDAEFALAKTGGTVSKAHLLELVDKIGGSVGVGKGKALVGDEAEGAVAAFMKTRTKIADALPDDIPYEDLRGIMRQLRADIKGAGGYGGKAGEFSNGTLTGMKKDLTKSVSDFLKGANDDYRKAMETMAPKSSVLEEMSDNFGDQPQALSSLQTIVNNSSPKAKYLRDLLNRFAEETGNGDLLTKLKSMEEARGIVSSPTAQRGLMESMPEYRDVTRAENALENFNPRRTAQATDLMVGASPQTAKIAQLGEQIEDVQGANKRFAGWSQASSQGRLQSAMSGRNIENVRAVEELSARSGLDFTKMLDDRRVADAFDKGFMHGSRNVNLWSLVGSLFGGKAITGDPTAEPMLRLLGAGFGAQIDTAGPRMTKKALDGFLSLKNSRFGPMLEQAAEQGAGSVAATHLMLSQQDPEYKAMVDHMQADAMDPNSADVPKSFDPAIIAAERMKLQKNEGMSSVDKAKALSQMNKSGYVVLPEPEPEIDVEQLPPDVDVDDLMQALEAVQ